MALDVELLHCLTTDTQEEAWRVIVNAAIEIMVKPLAPSSAPNDVTKRDREMGSLDHFLSSCGWDLWRGFGDTVQRTSDCLVRWWAEPYAAKAVLILDGLSLRELPWLVQGAEQRGFVVHGVAAHASELPGETNAFARALGFGSRSQLQNNGGGASHKLQTAQTESVDMAWEDCLGLINNAPNWVFWHHWPDSKIHDGSGAGLGLDTLTRDTAAQLSSDDFWSFVERLATGRRLVITSDHGYAATGHFTDADGELGQFLKKTFASARSTTTIGDTGPFAPPVAIRLEGPHGPHLFAVGRWKWKSQGGYPTLTHGGLTLLEVLSPFVELTK